MKSYKAKVLSIAGSDASGGAGIQADIKTITMLGCYAASCITSITAQNTTGVFGIWDMSRDAIEQQILHVISDIRIDAIKIGMVPSNLVQPIAELIPKNIPVVLDPVVKATAGMYLVEQNDFCAQLLPLAQKATLLTPNAYEAEILSGTKVKSLDDGLLAGKKIMAALSSAGDAHLLITSVPSPGPDIESILFSPDGRTHSFRNAKKPGEFHGTGCTFSSAIACFLAQHIPLNKSIESALDYVSSTLQNVPVVGSGFNPVFHNHSLV